MLTVSVIYLYFSYLTQFVALADKDLQAEGLTEGARRKFLNNIEQFK